MFILVDGNRCCIPLEAIPPDVKSKIINELTIETKTFTGKIFQHKYFDLKGDDMWLPRHYGVNLLKSISQGITVNMTDGNEIPKDRLKEKNFNMTPMQENYGKNLIKNHFSRRAIQTGGAGAIAVLPTGSGKTFIGMAFLRFFGRKTLWITNSDVSVAKTKRLIKECNPGLLVATFDDVYSRTISLDNCDVLIATVHRFILPYSQFRRDVENAKLFANSIGCVIYDEIHTLGGPEFGKVFDLFSPKIQLGLSATPTRRDKAELKYILTVGPPFELEGIEPPTYPTRVLAVHFNNPITDKYKKWLYRDTAKKNLDIANTIRNITSDPDRRPILRRAIHDCLVRGEDVMGIDHPVCTNVGPSIIIFCNYHDEIDNMVHYLEGLVDEAKIKFEAGETQYAPWVNLQIHTLTAKTPPLAANDAISNARIIVTNYFKLSTAFSEERFIYCIIWSTTKTQITQAVGRVGRYCDYYKEWNDRLRIIYDIVDDGGSLSAIQYNYRQEQYRNLGFNIRTLRWDPLKKDYME